MNEEEEYECTVFSVFLQKQLDEVFTIIKERGFDVNERHVFYGSLLYFYVYNDYDMFPDDATIIEHLFSIGYVIHKTDPVSCIAHGLAVGRLNCVRYLLKRFPYWMDEYALKIYDECFDYDIALLRLVDLGFNLDLIYKKQTIPRILYNFTHARNIARAGAITVIGLCHRRLWRRGGGWDIGRIIARVIWESRALEIKNE